MEDDGGRRWLGGEAVLGGLLLVLGTLVLVGQALELDMGRVGWPFFVIVPGLGLLGLGLAASGRLGEVLATVGGVVTMAGLVLGVQNAADRSTPGRTPGPWWWWPVPGSDAGWWGSRAAAGTWPPAAGWLIAAGLGAFLVFAVFFEVVIGIGGRGYGGAGRYVLAALLILAGLVLLGRRLLAARRP
jgi:hypothetical protein